MSKVKISVLISGGGTNLQAIIDAIESGYIKHAEIIQVISSKDEAFGLTRAKVKGIKAISINKKKYETIEKAQDILASELINSGTQLIVLAGYLSILPKPIIEKFKERIINVHPSLIPKYCGEGFYGDKVHLAVLENKEEFSGATVHFVDEGVDTGPIISSKQVPVFADDSLTSLANRVHEVEHEILVEAVKMLCEKIYLEKR
jgi:phosphoribosylglycinamide formyltransferase-1